MWWDRFLWQLGFCVCHQAPERILLFGERPLFVCARDTGVFTSFFAALLALSLLTRRRRAGTPPAPVLLLVAAGIAFMAWDGFTSYWGWRESGNTIRFLSGFAAGTGLAFPVAAMLNREVFGGETSLKVGGSLREWSTVAVAASACLAVYLWRPAFLFRLGQSWLLVSMLGTLWSLNLLLSSLLLVKGGRRRPAFLCAVAAVLVAGELSAAYVLHRWLAGHGPGQFPWAARGPVQPGGA